MPISPKSLLPELLEQVIKRHEKQFEEKSKNLPTTGPAVASALFVELHSLLGDTLERALHLLDNQSTITLYYPANRGRVLAEISAGRKSQRVYKLMPHINYCECDYFARNVLQLPLPLQLSCSTASESEVQAPRYTCEHVLLLRLAKLLSPPPKIVEQILAPNEFNFLLGQMQPVSEQ